MATDEINVQDDELDEDFNDIDDSDLKYSRNEETEDDSDNDESDDQWEDSDSGQSGAESGGTAGAAGGMAAVAITVVTVLVLTAISNLNVAFNKLLVFGNSLEYEIAVTMEYDASQDSNVDWSSADTGLVLLVSNSKENFITPLITSTEGTTVSVTPKSDDPKNTIYNVELIFTGIVEGLVENRPYNVSVVGDEDGETKIYCSEDVKTTGPITEVRGIEGKCTCTIDGMYNFKLKYTDEGNYYQSFNYRVLSSDGKVVSEGTIDDPMSEQHITNVEQYSGNNFVLEITIQSTKPDDLEADHFEKELSDGMNIKVNQGTITLTCDIEM